MVCEDHFTPDSFEGALSSSVAASLNFVPRRKQLRVGALPTLIRIHVGGKDEKTRHSSNQMLKKRHEAQIKEELRRLKADAKVSMPASSQMVDPEPFTCNYTATDIIETCIPEQVTEDDDLRDGTCTFAMDEPAPPAPFSPGVEPIGLTLSCGHPCLMCMQQQNIPVTALSKDHTYHQQNSMQNSLTPQSTVHQPDCAESGNTCSVMSQSQGHIYTCSQQVESHSKEQNIQEETVWPDVPLCSTPLKTITNAREITYMEIDDEQDELINLSKLGNTFRDDSRDKTYEASESDCDSDLEQNITKCDLDLVSDKKYIVFNSCLQNLFVRLKCPECDSAVDPEDICTDETDNALLSCSIFCTSGHLVLKWASQPVLGKMAAGNLLTCAALLFSGQTYTHISQFASFLNLKFPTHTTFNRIQRENLMPVISYTWSTLQDELLKKVKESGKLLRLAGDGRCDSPGYSAKYCTYSLLDMDTDCIVSFVVVQVSETGSSCKMELEGFKRCMNYLIDLGFAIEVLATDRHVQIRSVMSKSYCDINHQFDVWHLANNVKKKLVQKAKAKGVEELAPWIKSISNHLWWCASNCNGDKNWLEECWKSVVHHISNIHEFDGDHLTRCPHEPLDPEVARKKRWLKIGSKAHNALKEVVLDKRLLKNIRQLSEFCHTGSLEVYHSLMTKYVPKRQEFDFDQMMARTALAVIDHNMSRNRPQATNKKGEKMFRVTYPKASSEWVAKPVYEAKTYDWIYAMLRRVVQEKETRTLSPVKV